MCKSMVLCVLIAVFARETSTADDLTRNDQQFERQLDIYDIPEYEFIGWPNPSRLRDRLKVRSAVNLTNVEISNIHTNTDILERNSDAKIIVPFETSSNPIKDSDNNNNNGEGNSEKPEVVGTKPINSDSIQPVSIVNSNSVVNKPTSNHVPTITNIKPGMSKPASLDSIVPVTSINKPIPNTHKPTTISNKPINAGVKPIIGNTPAVSNNKPNSNSNNPVNSNTKPVNSDVKPISSNIKPVINKPVASISKPVASHVNPIASNNKPTSITTTTEKSNKKKGNKQDQQKPPQQSSLSPCKCLYGQCTCCTGPILDLFQQKACLKVVYTPEDFAFDYSLLLNNRVMYQDRMTGKNPRPACIGLPRLSSLRMCAKFSNIYFAGRNVHMCLGMEGKWDSFELFSVSFECLRMGAQGFAVVKPEEGGLPLPGISEGLDSIIESGGDIEDYDETVVRNIFGSFSF